MCIIFLAPQCPSKRSGGDFKLITSLEAKPDIGLCVDPTSYSPIHCGKLEVRHKVEWYDKCQWCTDIATKWREGKENECAEIDRAEAEKLEKRRSLEMEIVKKEEEIVKKAPEKNMMENERPHSRDRRCCA
jgi:hypothetical protein